MINNPYLRPSATIVRNCSLRALSARLRGSVATRFCASSTTINLQAWVSAQEALDVMPSMDLPAIPQEHDWPAEVTQQLPEKGDDLGASDVAGMEIKVQPEPVASGRHGERRNDRDLVTAVA